MDMFKDIGINAWGNRHKIKKALEEINIDEYELPQNNSSNQDQDVYTVTIVGDFSDIDIGNVENEYAVEKGYEMAVVPSESNFTVEKEIACDLCLKSTQHKCRKCNIFVCNLGCSVPDPNSDNESHRVHLQGDLRCKAWNTGSFHCPKCDEILTTNLQLQNHIEKDHEEFESSLPTMS